MEPKSYLRLLATEWLLIVELFKVCKTGPIDYISLVNLVDAHKKQDINTDALIDKFIDYSILGFPLTGETLYPLGHLTEHTVRQLLHEQQLGLSESIQAYISRIDEISQELLEATNPQDYDQTNIIRGWQRIFAHTQEVKRQVYDNLQAIINIVAEAKRQETSTPLRQRYAEIIAAWDQYIKPMGDMVDVNGAFDSIIDSAVSRTDQAVKNIEQGGSLISEIGNVSRAKHTLNDMRSHILVSFQRAREILKPLYEIARLNSKVTRGASIIIDGIQKSKFSDVEEQVSLKLYKKPRGIFVSHTAALMKYHYNYHEIKNRPPPTIPSARSINSEKNLQLPPMDMKKILKQFRADLPIADVVKWAIDHYPDISASYVLDVVMLSYKEKGIRTKIQESCTHRTKTHLITGSRVEVEVNHG